VRMGALVTDKSRSREKSRLTAAALQEVERDLSIEDRMMQGKSLREGIPRSAHALWKPASDRPKPIDLLLMADEKKLSELLPIKYARMRASPFTFFRGFAALMATDLIGTPATGLIVQCCGDAHLGNFGIFGAPDRSLVFDINDFDETALAPWEWDLKRLATSAVLAGAQIKMGKKDQRISALTVVSAYRTHMRELAGLSTLEIWYSRFTEKEASQILNKTESKFAEEAARKARSRTGESLVNKIAKMKNGEWKIADSPPLVFHPPNHKEIFDHEVKESFDRYTDSLDDDRRALLQHYRMVDIAMKVVGIGSVGTTCGLILLVGKNGDPLFLQVKEAGQSVLEKYGGMNSSYSNQGQRVVSGQKLMQSASDIFLGWSNYEGKRFRGDIYFRQ
jgi:uncharacterized protein (DUF2252 family)